MHPEWAPAHIAVLVAMNRIELLKYPFTCTSGKTIDDLEKKSDSEILALLPLSYIPLVGIGGFEPPSLIP